MIESISDEHLAAIARCDPSLIVGYISRFTLLDTEGITLVFDIAKQNAKSELARRTSRKSTSLLPCPFCGQAYAKVSEVPSGDGYKFIVLCVWCHAQTAPRDNQSICKEDWNTRYDT